MKARLIWGFFLLAGCALLNSCGKDPEPNAGVSFDVETEAINESDGKLTSFSPELQAGGVGQELKVKIVFDKPLTGKTVLTYTVTGTANKKTITTGTGTSATTSYSDFYLNGGNAKDTETLIVEAGASDATITLTIFEDYDFEVDDKATDGTFVETVILTLTEVVSGPASLGDKNLINTLSIVEDDAVFLLNWEPQDGKVADLDLIVTTGGKVANYSDNLSNDGSIATGGEGLFIPAGYPAGTYNLSYPYYSGTSDNVKFTAYMFSNSGTLNGKAYQYGGTSALTFVTPSNYKLANINAYTDYTATATRQTMVKSGINYSSISTIVAPAATSSRTNAEQLNVGDKSAHPPLKLRNDQVRKILKNLKL